MRRLSGTLAAALTPLGAGGEAPALDAVGPYADFLVAGGVDGIFALGSTGECVLLDLDERRAVTEAFREATRGRVALAVHAGAISTRDTVALAEHAAEIGADAVAAIAPPYYPFTPEGLLHHFAAAAAACAPLPFYAYEFAARSGYAIPVDVLLRLQEQAPNFVGLKTSDKPFSAVEPYLLEGVDVFVGFEPMIPEALAAGAVGSVSGLAAVFPKEVVAVVRDPSEAGSQRLVELRAIVEPILPRGKVELERRGLMRRDCRAPMLALQARRTKHDAVIERLRAAVLDTPGILREPPPEAEAYVEKVRRHAYRVTDADVDALRAAGLGDEQIFELTIATALEQGLRRLA